MSINQRAFYISAFVFALDGSHLSIKHKTPGLFCAKRYSALSIDHFFNFWNISKTCGLVL